MILRDYQSRMVEAAQVALHERGNTLIVSPTGSGKTVCLSALGAHMGGKQLIIQHRDELTEQNMAKYALVNPGASTGLFNATRKDFSKTVTFGMVQSLARHLADIPRLDGIIVDEAHHVMAGSYLNVISAAKEKNPDLWLAGFTATPARGDGKGLRPVFDNCCSQITVAQLIKMGFLVPAKTFISRIGNVPDEILKLKIKRGEYDMDEAEAIMDKPALNQSVVQEWQKLAGGRQTIVFCTTIKHAENLTVAFVDAGIKAAAVTSMTSNREDLLRAFDNGELQVILNVAVLTEGYDSPPTSCVVLCRPCSFKSTMVQMIGRGLRPYEGKRDCYVLDFGASLLVHKNLDMAVRFDSKPQGDAPLKECPKCAAAVPLGVIYCPICGAEFTRLTREEILHDPREAELIEVDILNSSPFRWEDIFGSGKVLISSGFNAWACLASPDGINWTAVGGLKGSKNERLTAGDKLVCMSMADDFMRLNEDSEYARKAARWMNDPATPAQLNVIGNPMDFGLTKYKAACLAKFKWSQKYIERVLNV